MSEPKLPTEAEALAIFKPQLDRHNIKLSARNARKLVIGALVRNRGLCLACDRDEVAGFDLFIHNGTDLQAGTMECYTLCSRCSPEVLGDLDDETKQIVTRRLRESRGNEEALSHLR